ncbi:MAG: hypothetical protein Hals2KO_30670 [Halioglobus sp.]
MRDELASARYLQHYIEADLPQPPQVASRWSQVLVIPAYRERDDFLQRLSALETGSQRILVIVVLNQPDTEPDRDCNRALRNTLRAGQVVELDAGIDVCTLDLDQLRGPLPASKGVGLARKAGCDLAFKWLQSGAINSDWICNTDADATLPADYFERLTSAPPKAPACVFPFVHVPSRDGLTDSAAFSATTQAINAATALYELRLHHYVLGLEYAGSPYAYHTLGSCIAIRVGSYAHLRGFPQRSGGEDFYLLNKAAKLGRIERLPGACIQLATRRSSRVPFGTGPAVEALAGGNPVDRAAVFYNPQVFEVLRVLLQRVSQESVSSPGDIDALLGTAGLPLSISRFAVEALTALGIDEALAHCHRQSKSVSQFQRQFSIWLDGFRTLKLIHYLRDAGAEMLTLTELEHSTPNLWPLNARDASRGGDVIAAVHNHWNWTH